MSPLQEGGNGGSETGRDWPRATASHRQNRTQNPASAIWHQGTGLTGKLCPRAVALWYFCGSRCHQRHKNYPEALHEP